MPSEARSRGCAPWGTAHAIAQAVLWWLGTGLGLARIFCPSRQATAGLAAVWVFVVAMSFVAGVRMDMLRRANAVRSLPSAPAAVRWALGIVALVPFVAVGLARWGVFAAYVAVVLGPLLFATLDRSVGASWAIARELRTSWRRRTWSRITVRSIEDSRALVEDERGVLHSVQVGEALDPGVTFVRWQLEPDLGGYRAPGAARIAEHEDEGERLARRAHTAIAGWGLVCAASWIGVWLSPAVAVALSHAPACSWFPAFTHGPG